MNHAKKISVVKSIFLIERKGGYNNFSAVYLFVYKLFIYYIQEVAQNSLTMNSIVSVR